MEIVTRMGKYQRGKGNNVSVYPYKKPEMGKNGGVGEGIEISNEMPRKL